MQVSSPIESLPFYSSAKPVFILGRYTIFMIGLFCYICFASFIVLFRKRIPFIVFNHKLQEINYGR